MSQEPSLAINSVFGDFVIRRMLGKGTFGSVYEALWNRTGRRVALKVLHQRHGTDQDAIERLLREASALRQLHHPHIVDVFHVGEQNGLPYIVLEYLEGTPLDRFIAQRKLLPLGEALGIFLPVLTAVDAMHQRGIVHRDLKPGNIVLVATPDGTCAPKVLDFGLAKFTQPDAQPSGTRPLVGMGTPNYMPPEQIRDAAGSTTARSDQFSLSVILYVMLTGQRPFDARSDVDIMQRVLTGDFLPPSLVLPTLPRPVDQAIVRALKMNPESRFPSLREFGAALLPFASPDAQATYAKDFEPRVEPEAAARRPSQTQIATRNIREFDGTLEARRLRQERERNRDRKLLGVWALLLAGALAAEGAHVLEREEPAPAFIRPSTPTTTTPSTLALPPPPQSPIVAESNVHAEPSAHSPLAPAPLPEPTEPPPNPPPSSAAPSAASSSEPQPSSSEVEILEPPAHPRVRTPAPSPTRTRSPGVTRTVQRGTTTTSRSPRAPVEGSPPSNPQSPPVL